MFVYVITLRMCSLCNESSCLVNNCWIAAKLLFDDFVPLATRAFVVFGRENVGRKTVNEEVFLDYGFCIASL